ncbi:MAG: DNA mismatch repair endonuclease MutL [Vicinamibacterales bacterium]
MGKIVQLPVELANQIAAGEVVERPASVVKELVENAIDAGARRIRVTVELGGKALIRVEDDGEGMSPEDARLALARHATSKIRKAEDLAAITTLGFRGEALPSIASVSHFTLKTRTAGAPAGTEIRVDGGTMAAPSAVGVPTGTSIEVRDLFYNLPARRKFLKSDGAESAQISKVVTQFALCYPEVGFSLTSGPRTLLQTPPAATLRDRLYQVYGDRPDLVEVHREGDITVTGFVAALAEQGPVRGPQHVFINRRIVKDRTIGHAILDAYGEASIRERAPEVHLFLDMRPDSLDVNVHPTKAEVRFREQSHVHEVVKRAVADSLGQSPVPQVRLHGGQGEIPGVAPLPVNVPLPGAYAGVFANRWRPGGPGGPGVPGYADVPAGDATASAPSSWSGPDMAGVREAADALAAAPAGTPETFGALMPLGQYRDTFIIAIDEFGLAIIDQHVAHERILYEQIAARLTSGPLASQRLLEPLLVDVSAAGQEALATHAADLDRLGFDVDVFGPGVVRVSAVPAIVKREDADATLRAMADDLDGLDTGDRAQEAVRLIAATMACHAAVKANYPLTHEKMVHLLHELRQTAHSTVCPHGRPVMLRLTRREIERSFERA